MIRNATHEDIDVLVLLGREMHKESRYREMPFSEPKVRNLLAGMIVDPNGCLLVYEKDGKITGGIAGFISEHYFSTGKIASDLALFITQDKRGGMAAARLVKAFAQWATEAGADIVQVGVTTGVNTDGVERLYNALGFKNVGIVFSLE